MIVLELRFIAQAHHTQDGANGARARVQDRADDEDLDPVPDASAEGLRKGAEDGHNLRWQVKHHDSLSSESQLTLPSCCCLPHG